ncbi:MAG: hypothetical protein ACREP7_11295, partial [Lysobacter sp.]
FGIRHGTAARTGQDDNPYRCNAFHEVLLIAVCYQTAMASGACAHSFVIAHAPPVPKHRGTAL